MKVELRDKERIDDLQRNGYQIIQNREKFCFGMDAVLLTGFAHARERDTMLDLGTGTGIIPLLMEAKYHCSHLTGLEIQEESADMARRSVALNDLQNRIDIVTGDIKEADQIFPAASFDCITCNPPYMIGQHGLTNPEEPKAIARHEVLCTLEDVVGRTAKLLKPGGHFYMVHRPFRLAEIMTMLVKYKLEPKRMQLVYPYIDNGQLIPDELMIDILASVYDSFGKDHAGVIFDGFPRTTPQAEALKKMLSERGHKIAAMIELAVPEDELMARLINRGKESGRSDDNEETIKKRLNVYHTQTAPLIDWYEKEGIHHHIEGLGTVDEIFARVCNVIDNL